jgi:hypothetical protein
MLIRIDEADAVMAICRSLSPADRALMAVRLCKSVAEPEAAQLLTDAGHEIARHAHLLERSVLSASHGLPAEAYQVPGQLPPAPAFRSLPGGLSFPDACAVPVCDDCGTPGLAARLRFGGAAVWSRLTAWNARFSDTWLADFLAMVCLFATAALLTIAAGVLQ